MDSLKCRLSENAVFVYFHKYIKRSLKPNVFSLHQLGRLGQLLLLFAMRRHAISPHLSPAPNRQTQ